LPLTGLEPRIDSLANQEVLRWQQAMLKELGDNVTLENIKEYLWKTLKSGQVVPGLVTNVFPGKVPTANNIQLWARCLAQVRSALHCASGILRHSARLAQEPYDPTREKGAVASRRASVNQR
jgi:Cdc6-like AAA superfamily ATPase